MEAFVIPPTSTVALYAFFFDSTHGTWPCWVEGFAILRISMARIKLE